MRSALGVFLALGVAVVPLVATVPFRSLRACRFSFMLVPPTGRSCSRLRFRAIGGMSLGPAGNRRR